MGFQGSPVATTSVRSKSTLCVPRAASSDEPSVVSRDSYWVNPTLLRLRTQIRQEIGINHTAIQTSEELLRWYNPIGASDLSARFEN